MDRYLRSTAIIDWTHPAVAELAQRLAAETHDPFEITKRSFEWVRDEIRHSHDYHLNLVTCTASEVLQGGSGFCYAKSHLLAALLRANGIESGFCYQRLSRDDNGAPYSLHGFNAVRLPGIGWYRVDPRGNRADVNAQFDPPHERLAFGATLEGERDLPEIWADPLPVVVEALQTHSDANNLWNNLPDVLLRG